MVFAKPSLEIISEGVMYGTGQSFVGRGTPSLITIDFDASPLLLTSVAARKAALAKAKDPTHHHGGTHGRIGVLVTTQHDLAARLPVEPSLRPLLECKANYVERGNFSAYFFDAPSKVHVRHEVTETALQIVMLYVCPGSASSLSDPPILRFDGAIAFRNPYGYLSAAAFGFLPYFASLASLYVAAGGAFGCIMALNVKFIARLQWLVLALFVLGLVETIGMFGLFAQINASGETACCPVLPLAVVTVILNALKRCASRMLLLVVCFGFGITKSKIPFTRGCSLVVLSVAYLALAINNDMRFEENGTPRKAHSWTNVPVVAVDIVFLTWTFLSLGSIKAGLREQRQTAKLLMYTKLTAVLAGFVFIWSALAAFEIAVGSGFFSIEWRFAWLIHSFWHTAYFILLLTIAIIWRPSRVNQELGYWSQLSMVEDGDEYDDDDDYVDGDLEEFAGAENFVDEEEFGVDDDEEGFQG